MDLTAIDTPLGPNIIYIAEHGFVQYINTLFTLWPKYKWVNDDTQSKINIVQYSPSVSSNMFDKPSVVIHFTNVLPVSIPPGRPLSMESIAGESAQTEYILQTSIFCSAPNEIEAETISVYLLRAIPTFKKMLQKRTPVGVVSRQIQMHMAYDDASKVPNIIPKEWFTSTISLVLRVDDISTYINMSDYATRIREFEEKLEIALSTEK